MLYLGKTLKSWKTQTPGMNIEKIRKQRRRTLYLGKLRKETKPTENTGTSQAILVDPTEDTETTEVSEQAVAEEIEVTDTIDVTEVATGIPEPTLEVTSKEKEESTTTPSGSP